MRTGRHSDELLRRLRNHPDWPGLLRGLGWPHRERNGRLEFVCPLCGERQTAVNPRTNLGRCFVCERNFNPIELVMAIDGSEFTAAVARLLAVLDLASEPTPEPAPGPPPRTRPPPR